MVENDRVNILLVDDRVENLVALELVLADLGQNLVKATSGREALRYLLDDEFAVILLDVQMPEMDGFETARLIREREKTQHTPIVFMTAIDKSEMHVARGYSVGAVDYLFKPLDPDILKAKVVAFVELAKKTQELQQEIAQRKTAEANLDRSNTLMATIGRSLVEFLEEVDPAAAFHLLLRGAVPLTGSDYGFIGEVLHDGGPEARLKCYASLNGTGRAERRASGNGRRPEPEICSPPWLAGWLAERGAPWIAQRAGQPLPRAGLPGGAPALRSFLALPICKGDTLLGMVGLGNRPGGYDPALVDYLQPVLNTCASILSACRSEQRRTQAEEEVRRLNEDLERRVVERTQALEAANREIQDAGRRKDEFLAMLAHELRNPLAAIANAEYILDEIGWPEPRVERLRSIINRQTQNLSRLVDDLLDISRITRGKIELRRETVELATIVQRAVEATSPFVEARDHTLTIDLPQSPVWLEADPTRLEQVLANLLHNAAKYTEPGGKIWLSVGVGSRQSAVGSRQSAAESQPEGFERSEESDCRLPAADCRLPTAFVSIRIRDTGIGIAPELLPHVFDLFTQAEPSLDRTQGGLGIGLALVRNLVEMHGGTVTGTSEGSGRGSEFTVQLPTVAAGPPDGEEPGDALEPAGHPAGRVLIVEDNRDAAETLAQILELWGHEVRVAHTGPAAIAEVQRYHPEAVLLDIGLPGMDGYEVARRLRQDPALRDALIVALTGYGQSEDRQRSEAAGIDEHLTKPVDPQQLHRLLGAAVA